MSARCTGRCCHDISFTHPPGRDRGLDSALASLVFRPLGQVRRDNGRELFECLVLGSSGCRLSYESRPACCRAFPNAYCTACGAKSDAEARGVALQVRA